MSSQQTLITTHSVETPSGRISYASAGSGPAALFVHGVVLRDTLDAMLADKTIFRSPGALGPAYERPETVTDEDIEAYLRPLVRSEQRIRDLQRFDCRRAPEITRLALPSRSRQVSDSSHAVRRTEAYIGRSRLRSPANGRGAAD